MPFVLQHGLGGDIDQPFGLFAPPPGVRLLAFDCRGHGQTSPLGEPDELCFATFAGDLLALIDHLEIEEAIVGGISMGAGVALAAALRSPHRFRGLVLIRPAWLDGPMPEQTREIYATIARLIRLYGVDGGQRAFARLPGYRQMLAQFPATAASLLGQFKRLQAEEGVSVLDQLPRDPPVGDLRTLAALSMPTLVLANGQDPVHPLAYGAAVAQAIPGARFEEITPKEVDSERHAADIQASVTRFCRAVLGGGGEGERDDV